MLYSKAIEDYGRTEDFWIFKSPNYDYSYKFYNLLCEFHIKPYDVFEFTEPDESFDYIDGCFVYAIGFMCSEKIRKRIEYIFRRYIHQDFITSHDLLLGLTDDNYYIERNR